MNTCESLQAQVISQQILRYLAVHPDAADNLNGVINWWLIEQPNMTALEHIESALDSLIQQNAVERIRNPDGTTIYRARRSV